MNIKISKEEHEFLLKRCDRQIPIGSRMYGNYRPNSDTDLLCIYRWPEAWGSGDFLPNIHQFQYTEDNIDYIWTTEEQFWKNQRSGDSTINSDVILFSEIFGSDDAVKLKLCRTQKCIKAYLGFAKRDLKQVKEGQHKITHAARCLYFAGELLEGRIPKLQYLGLNVLNRAYAGAIINAPNPVEALKSKEADLREKCNKMYDNKELETYYVSEVSDPLLQKLLNSNNTREFRYE